MESELQILISAVDEASATMAEIGESMSGMAEEVSTASDAASESFAEFGLQINATTGEIENALLTQQQSFDLMTEVMQTDVAEIQDLILSEGLSFEEASATIEEANAAIAVSSEEAGTVSAGAYAGLAAIAGIGFLAIKGAIGDAVSSAQAWDETSATVAQTLKDTGSSIPLSEVQAYAQQIQATTLFTQQDALQSEELILTHKDLQGSFEQVTVLAADLATKMGTDLPSATKILTNALSDPVAGINQLIRQGNVDFPAATVTMIQNLAKMGDTSAADSVILDALNTSIGGVATSAAGAPGAALTQMNNQLAALGTVIGNDLLPLLDTLAKDLEPIIQKVSAWAEEHPKLTDAIVLGSAALAGLLLLIGLIGVAIITVTPVIEVIGVVIGALGAVIAVLTSPIALVVIAIIALAATVYFNWNLIKTETETVWNAVASFLSATWNTISGFFTTIWDGITEAAKVMIDLMVGFIVEALDTFDPKWRAQWQSLSDFFTDLWNTLKTFIVGLWAWITAQFTTALQGINDLWSTVWGGISSFFIGIWTGIESALSGALSSIRGDITSFVSWASGVFTPVLNAINGIGGAVAGFLKTTINIGAAATGIQVNDAIITPGGDIIQSDPADYLIATKTPGSLVGAGGGGGPAINIYIQGGNYLDQNGATMIGNALAKQITQQLRVRNYQP